MLLGFEASFSTKAKPTPRPAPVTIRQSDPQTWKGVLPR
jgi:hypothetical protein